MQRHQAASLGIIEAITYIYFNAVDLTRDQYMMAVVNPGQSLTDFKTVKQLIEEIYAIQVESINKLNSHDNNNLLIRVTSGHLYVLKLLSKRSDSDWLIGIGNLMVYLHEHGIKCPLPVKLSDGRMFSFHSTMTETEIHNKVIFLQTYVPGSILYGILPSNEMYFSAGKYLGQIDNILKGFHDDRLVCDVTLGEGSEWFLTALPKLRSYYDVISDNSNMEMVEFYIKQFEDRVLTNLHHLKEGTIHGDFHDENIIINDGASDSPYTFRQGGKTYQMTGIIDFNDAQCSYYLFEVAIAIACFMLESDNPLLVGGHFLAGYLKNFQLPDFELTLLYNCIAGRLCQEAVLGNNQLKLGPTNVYLSDIVAKAWKTLHIMKQTTQQFTEHAWSSIIDSHVKTK
ncbi:hydroxylysine kinase-like [Saccoglossus kowalevskii]|uniref:Hydroxylysine kinase n=1 Tax=Saccoglossus kowalevskii TaxID=10224 RepID=A0ABM0GU44_SACKO|nr:PREDICTED: hydroxylysine kinase-like [Saccoglossus kowalevskii]